MVVFSQKRGEPSKSLPSVIRVEGIGYVKEYVFVHKNQPLAVKPKPTTT